MHQHQGRRDGQATVLRHWLCGLLFLLAASEVCAQATCTWNVDGPGTWGNPSSWNDCGSGNGTPAGTPGPADHAVIGNIAPNADIDLGTDPRSVDRLTLTAGRLHGDADLTVSTHLIWTGGRIDGSATLATDLILALAATADLSGGLKVLQRRDFINLGTITWVDGDIELREDAEIDNQGVIGIDVDGAVRGFALVRLQTDGSPQARLHNAANPGVRIDKTGNGVAEFAPDLQFDNGNAVNVSEGILAVRGPGSDFGNYNVSSPGALHFGPPTGVTRELTGATAVSGDGLLHKFDQGQLTISGAYMLSGPTEVVDGLLYFDTPADPLNLPAVLVQEPGVLSGLDNLAVTSSLVWNGGDIAGASPGVTLTLGAAASGLVALDPLHPNATLDSRNLINQGTLTVSASGSSLTFLGVEAASIDNQGVFELNSTSNQNLALDCLTTDACTFTNQPGATVRLTDQAGGVVIIGQQFAAFDNNGLVELTQGCGAIGAPGNDTSGTYRYAGTCTLYLAPRPDFERVLASTVLLDQQGTTSLQVGGRLVFNGASRNFGSVILDPLGTLAGAADFVFTESLIWRGEIEGSVITQGMTISAGAIAATSSDPADTPVLARRTLTIDGELNLSEVKLNLFDAAIDNAGILNLVATPAAGGGILCPSPPTCGTVTNQAGGALQSLAFPGGPTNEIGTDIAVVNQGTLQVDSGVLILEGPYSSAAGSVLDVGFGAGLRRTSGPLVMAAGTLRGSGVIDASVSVDAVTIQPGGALTGNLGVLGNFSSTGSSFLLMQVQGATPPAAPQLGAAPPRGAPGGSYDRLSIAGTASLAGTLDVVDLGFVPAPTDFFDLLTYASVSGDFGSSANPYSGLGFVLQTQATRVRLAQPGAGTTCTWNPGGAGADDWTNPAKWNGCSTGTGPGPGPVGTPGAGDTAIVGSGTVNLDVPVAVNELQFTGGTIQGPSDLTITGSLVWTGGSFLGTSAQTVTIDLAATASISGGQHTVDGRTFVLEGIATWTTGLIELANGATFRINPTGQLGSNPSLNFESFFGSGAGTAQIDNDGAIIKLGGNTSGIGSTLEYTGNGSITVTAGTFIVAAGSPGSLDSSYTADAGAALQFVNGNRNFGATANLGGAGTLVFGDGGPQVSVNTIAGCIANDSNVAIRHAQVAINCTSPTLLRTLLMVDSAAILEGSSSIEVNFDLVWGHGLIRGTGAAQQFKLLAGATGSFPSPLGPAAARILDARTFTNHGDITWFGENALAVNNGAVFDNQTDGDFTLGGGTGTRAVISDQAGSPLFFNRGALHLINNTNADFDLGLGNTGTVNLIDGELRLRRNSTDTGSYDITAGSLLIFDGAGVTLTGTSLVTGAGAVDVINGAVLTVNGSFGPAGGVRAALGGSIDFSTGAPVSLALLTVDGGTLTGSDEVRVATQMLWEGGSVTGSGATPGPLNILPGAVLDMDAPMRRLDTRDLLIGGLANWLGGALRVPQNQSGKVVVQGGGTLSIQTFKSIARLGCVAEPCTVEFELGGSLLQVGDGAELLLSSPLLMGNGLLRAQGSPLTINAGVQVNGGVVQVDLNSALITPTLTLDGGFLRGQGDITGNVVNNAGRVQPGSSPGDLGIIGNYTQGPGGALDIQVGGLTPGVQSDHVTVSGSATLDGTLDASIVGYTLTSPDVLEILSAGGGVLGSFSTSNIAHPGYAAVYAANAVTLEPAGPVSLVVNSVDDSNDGACDATHCSLREALIQANLMPDPDTIEFNIPSPQCTGPGGACTIAPSSALPVIVHAVLIDGFSQPGASVNSQPMSLGLGSNSVLLIELDGALAGGDGLVLNTPSLTLSVVQGLSLFRWNNALVAQGPVDNTIAFNGNFVGLRADGSAPGPAGASGISVNGGSVVIGDGFPDTMNVIGGHANGIRIDNSVTGGNVLVQGNLVGLAPDGASPRPNQIGIELRSNADSPAVVIGGNQPDQRNVISGNNGDGIRLVCLAGAGTCLDGAQVIGNFIGPAASGGVAGNGGNGVNLNSASFGLVRIGGTGPGTGNRIAYNTGDGIVATFSTARASFLRNDIFFNIGQGIDLGANGRSENDPGDGDSGPNDFLNYPRFTSFDAPGGTSAVIEVILDTPDIGGNYPMRVDFYKAVEDEPGVWLGTTSCAQPGVTCPASFVFPGGVSLTPSDVVVGVVTDAQGRSSEASFYNSFTVISSDSPDPSTIGTPYTVSVDISSLNSPFSPLGAVAIDDGIGNNCLATLAPSGPAVASGSCQLPSLAAATLTLTANYAPGDLQPFSSSSNQAVHTVTGLPPVITQVIPAFGPAAGGNVLTVTGSNFELGASTSFSFGGSPGTAVNCATTTRCTLTVPAGSARVDIRATTSAGTSVDTLADDYSYRGAAPTTCSTFGAPAPFAAGSGPLFALAHDFNASGSLDLAVTNGTSNDVSILLGAGDGTFATFASLPVQSSPNLPALGDFDGNGLKDLAVPNRFGGSVSILLATGPATFGAASNIPVGTRPRAVAVGDFNGDGRADLAVADEILNLVSILPGNGNGTFGTATTFATGNLPNMIAVGDFNRDGRSDLATANRDSSNLSILLGNGDGSFAAASNIAAGSTPFHVAIADLDGDGDSDLVSANQGSANVSVLLGAGDGTFGAASNFPAAAGPFAVEAADFNGDGFVDVVSANASGNSVSVLLGNGTGTLGAASNFPAGTGPGSVTVGDFNGDGRSDLVVATFGTNQVQVLLNVGCPPTVASISPTSGSEAGGTTVTLTGSDFVPGSTTVSFGMNPAVGVACTLPTLCTATSPPGTGVVDVIATTADGSSANTAADDYTYLPMGLPTTTTITSVLPAAVVTGQSYTVSVLVEALIPRGNMVTAGTVIVRQLSDNSSCSIDLASASSCSLSSPVALNTAVRAFYQGSGSFDPSSSAPQAISVDRADTTIAIVEDTPDPSAVNQPVTVRVNLAVTAPGAGTPTGEILITDGTASCGITLPNLSCTLLPKALGQATIEARYPGDANFNPSTDTEAHTISADGADLSIIKRNGLRLLPGGQPSTYVLLVSNAGPQSVVNARVTDILPAQLSAASWTCSAATGSSCPASGSGNVDALVSIGAGSSVSFELTATAQANPEQVVTNTATVVPPTNAPDPELGNNSSTDVDPIGVFGEGFESENE